MLRQDNVRPGLEIIRKGAWIPEELDAKIKAYEPNSRLGALVKDILVKYALPVEQANELLERITSALIVEGKFGLRVIRQPYSQFLSGHDLMEDLGIVSFKTITTTGAEAIVDNFHTSTGMGAYHYHALGTSTAAEAAGSTGLTAELAAAEYNGGVRATGSSTETSATVYKTVGTNTMTTTKKIEEHGICNSATPSTGNLFDRHLTGAQNLSSGDSLQSTWELTVSAGG